MQNRTTGILWDFLKMRTSGIRTSRDRTSGGPPVPVYQKLWLDFLILRLQWFMLLVRSFIIDVRFIMSNVLNHECLFRNGTFFKFIRYPNCVFLDAICNLLILAKPAKRLFKNENMNLSYPHVWYSACMLWLRNELLPYMLLENYFCRCISWDIQLQH